MSDLLRDTLQQTLGGAYQIERELGGGGMSRVFVAHDRSLDRDVVVKVLSAESTSGLSGDRFRREIQLIARLQHPHIVPILTAGAADGALYYVMPFVSGETLRERMTREGPLPVPDAVKVLRELLDALAFAHEHGVVHRDIKPENVLIEAGHVVVADFGIAKALLESGNLTSAGIALGTPAYMAPEQATADPGTDHRADLYAVGVLAYELLAGVPPFQGSAQQVITAHITTPAPPLRATRADVPERLADVIARALEKEPSARPQSANAMLTAIDAGMMSPPPNARREAAATRKRWPVVAAAAVLVLAAAGVVMARRSAAALPVVADGADLIAVMPLGAVSDTSLARLGQDLVVTISTNLDGVGALRTIDAATLLLRTRTLPSPIPLADAQQLAKQLGARSVMTGTLISEGDRVRASVVLRMVGSDSTLAKATALAPPQEIAALTDSLTWAVLRQVWRRGSAPSPVLTGLTTASFDALRAFLDGERHFQRLDAAAALSDLRRAFEQDTNFAQAYLRYEYVNEWNLRPRDTVVHARLFALKDRLPERERLWVETRARRLPVPQQFAEWKRLVERFPDYPPFLMAAADPVIHSGPLYGISMSEAAPYVRRFGDLVPDHADGAFHEAMIATTLGTPAEGAEAMEHAGRMASGAWGALMTFTGEMLRARATGGPMPPLERAFPVARALASQRGDFIGPAFSGSLGFLGDRAYRLAVLERVRSAGIYGVELERASAYGESMLRVERGDWAGGVRAAERVEIAGSPLPMRLAAARASVLGAWLEAVAPDVADSAVRRAKTFDLAGATPVDRAELLWMDGLVGVMQRNETRLRAAIAALSADTTPVMRHAARSLAGLWLDRTDPRRAADSLKALSDAVMQGGAYLLPAEGLNRMLISRELRRQGSPAAAEHYLMWTDAVFNGPRTVSTRSALGALTEFERGSAFDAAGNAGAAVTHYRRFLESYDQPPPAHRAKVVEARQRVAELESTDAAKRKTVAK